MSKTRKDSKEFRLSKTPNRKPKMEPYSRKTNKKYTD